MLKTILIIIAILGVFAVAGFAWAKHKGYCTGGDYLQRASERISHKLDLNDEQDAHLQGLTQTLHGLREGWAEHRTELSTEIERLLATPTLDRVAAMDMLPLRESRAKAPRHEARVRKIPFASSRLGASIPSPTYWNSGDLRARDSLRPLPLPSSRSGAVGRTMEPWLTSC